MPMTPGVAHQQQTIGSLLGDKMQADQGGVGDMRAEDAWLLPFLKTGFERTAAIHPFFVDVRDGAPAGEAWSPATSAHVPDSAS
jgi:hypothetical protein